MFQLFYRPSACSLPGSSSIFVELMSSTPSARSNASNPKQANKQPAKPVVSKDSISRPAISKDAINKLPLHRYEGPILIVSTDAEAKKAAKDLKKEKILGFDTETRPAFKKNQSFLPSVLQLATAKCVYLIKLQDLKDFDWIAAILSDEKHIKCGVALDHDAHKLAQIFPFTSKSLVDLGKIAHKHHYKQTGLRSLCALLLGFRLSKGAQVSNWSKPILSPSQIVYAATDAWVSRELYLFMKNSPEWKLAESKPPPPQKTDGKEPNNPSK